MHLGFGCFAARGLRLGILPVEGPPEWSRADVLRNVEFSLQRFLEFIPRLRGIPVRPDAWPERGGDLGVGQPHDGVKAPEQVARLGPRVDDLRYERHFKHPGRRLGELRLSDTRLAPDQQGSPRRQRRPDRLRVFLLEDVKLLEKPRFVEKLDPREELRDRRYCAW